MKGGPALNVNARKSRRKWWKGLGAGYLVADFASSLTECFAVKYCLCRY